MNKPLFDTAENRAEILAEWVEIYERFRKNVQESVDRTNNELVDFAIRIADVGSKRTVTEAKKSAEPVPILVKPVEKLPESENDVSYWGM